MPMAGDGTRFNNGFKPFINVKGIPLYQWSLKSLKSIKQYSLTFIIKEDDDKTFSIKKRLLKNHPNANVVILPKRTLGALDTCIQGIQDLDLKLPLVILDCDLYFNSPKFNKMVSKQDFDFKSGLLYFNSNQKWFSYCELKDEKVIKTREKEVISNNAIAGAYCFSRAELFKVHGTKALKSDLTTNGEYYISPIYNSLIKKGEIVNSYFCEEYYSLGTPEEVERNLEFLK